MKVERRASRIATQRDWAVLAGSAGTAHLLEQRHRPAGEGADHASARQAGVSRHDADRSAEQQRGPCDQLATMLAEVADESTSFTQTCHRREFGTYC